MVSGCFNSSSELSDHMAKKKSALAKLNKKDKLIFYAGHELISDGKLPEMFREAPYTVLLLDGDKEVYKLFKNEKPVKRQGANMYKLSDNVCRFASGGIIDMGGSKVLISNICRAFLIGDKDYFELCRLYMKRIIRDLEKHGNNVDYIFSVIPPHLVCKRFSHMPNNDIHFQYMDHIARNCSFKAWYFSVFSKDKTYENYHCIYRKPVIIQD